jgi:hypothetical protein
MARRHTFLISGGMRGYRDDEISIEGCGDPLEQRDGRDHAARLQAGKGGLGHAGPGGELDPGQAQEDRNPAWPSPCHDKAMRVKRFGARIAADPRGHAVIAVPFDPDEAWGAKARHHVNGTVNGCRVRVTIAPGDSGWAFTLNPARMRDTGIAVGSKVIVELAPEGPQRGDLADDISAALETNPAAAAFFDTLAQFYRRAYLRYIDATTRRPDLRAARIAEVVGLLADGIKERPRS